MRIEENKITASDGIELFGRLFNINYSRATIIIIHGLGEHSGRYEHVANYLNEKEYTVLTPDLRGHGLSGGKRGHAPSYEILLDDVTAWIHRVKMQHPHNPVFLYGHSMGGNIALNYAIRKNGLITGIIATSPWLKLVNPPNIFVRRLASILSRIAPKITFDNGLNSNDLSRSTKSREEHDADELVHSRITVRLFTIIQKSGCFARKHARELTCPALLLHGGNDRITSRYATQEFAKHAPGAIFIMLPECYHEIQNEPECVDALDRISNWISKITRSIPH